MLQYLLSIFLSGNSSAEQNAGDLDTNCKLNFQSSNLGTAWIRTNRDIRSGPRHPVLVPDQRSAI